MASAASRLPITYFGALFQSMSGPLSPDTGCISKASGIICQDLAASSKSKLPGTRALGAIPGYGLAPFDPLSLSNYEPPFNNMISGSTGSHRKIALGIRNRREPRVDLGQRCWPNIPEGLALVLLKALDPIGTIRYTIRYSRLGINHGSGFQFPGIPFRCFVPSSKAISRPNLNSFIKEPYRPKRPGHLRRYLGTRLKEHNSNYADHTLLEWFPLLTELPGGTDGSAVNSKKPLQGRGSCRQRSTGNPNGYTPGSGPWERKRKRGVDEDEENEDSNPPPPSKRVDRDSLALSINRLACPFARAAPETYISCLLIGRKNLSGIKEHLKRNHFGKTLPDNIRAAKTWNDVFDICNPDWHSDRDQRPSRYFEPRNLLSSSSGSSISQPKSIYCDGHPFSPLSHQKASHGVEFCSPPRSSSSASPINGVDLYPRRHDDQKNYDGGALSPVSCGHCSNQGSFQVPIEDQPLGQTSPAILFPPGSHLQPWPETNTVPHHNQESLSDRRQDSLTAATWIPNNANSRSDPQLSYYADDLRVGTSDQPSGFYPIPPLVDTSNEQSFGDSTTIDLANVPFDDYLHSEPDEEAQSWPHIASTVKILEPHPHIAAGPSIHRPRSSSGHRCKPSLQPAPKPRNEIVKPATRSHQKKYRLFVTRKPANPFSREMRGSHQFTFEDLDEFQLEFDPWLRREFTDPPFCWQKMEFLNGLEKARLESTQEVANNLEASFVQYRSFDAALYLVTKRSLPKSLALSG